jgi:WD40 repeat protein
VLHPDGKRLLIHGFFAGRSQGKLPIRRVELWDLAAGKLLRRVEASWKTEQGGSQGIVCDRDSFYLFQLELEYDPSGSRRWEHLLHYAWEGGDRGRPDRIPVLAGGLPGGSGEPSAGNAPARPWGGSWILWQPLRGREKEELRWSRISLLDLELQVGWGPRVALASPAQETRPVITNQQGWISPSGRLFALIFNFVSARGGSSRTLLWETKTGRLLADSPSSWTSWPPTIDPTQHWLAMQNPQAGSIDIYAASDGKLAHRVKLAGLPRERPNELPEFVQLSPAGDRLSFVHQGVVYLWDAVADKPVTVVDKPGHFGPVHCVAQHEGAQLIASGGSEGVVLLWDRRDGRFLRTLVGHAHEVVALAFHPDGTRLASASSDGTVNFWDVGGSSLWTSQVTTNRTAGPVAGTIGRPIGIPAGRAAQTSIVERGLVFDPAGSALWVGASGGLVLRLDVAKGRVTAELPTGVDGLAALALSLDGSLLATASPGGQVTIHDARLSRSRSSWEAGVPIGALAFAGSGGFLITGGAMIELREAATGRVLSRLDPPAPPVRAMEFDARTGELAYTDWSDALQLVSLADLNRAFRDLGLEIPGFPFRSSELLPSPLAEEVLREPPAKAETPRPLGKDRIPGVQSELWTIEENIRRWQ